MTCSLSQVSHNGHYQSHSVTLVTLSHTGHTQSHWSHSVTVSHTGHTQSQSVTLVTLSHTGHSQSHWSHSVTLSHTGHNQLHWYFIVITVFFIFFTRIYIILENRQLSWCGESLSSLSTFDE